MSSHADSPSYVGVYFLLVESYSRLSAPHRAVARAHCSSLTSHTYRQNREQQKKRVKVVSNENNLRDWVSTVGSRV